MSDPFPPGCEAALMRWYLKCAEAGRPASIKLQRWIARHVVAPVADGVMPFAKPPNRPPLAASDPAHAMAFLAAFVDPKYRDMPRSKGGRYAAVGDLLDISETTAGNRAKRFHADAPSMVNLEPLYEVSAEYAKRRGVAPATVRDWIAAWHERRILHRRERIARLKAEFDLRDAGQIAEQIAELKAGLEFDIGRFGALETYLERFEPITELEANLDQFDALVADLEQLAELEAERESRARKPSADKSATYRG